LWGFIALGFGGYGAYQFLFRYRPPPEDAPETAGDAASDPASKD
jgi:hypothetical protein